MRYGDVETAIRQNDRLLRLYFIEIQRYVLSRSVVWRAGCFVRMQVRNLKKHETLETTTRWLWKV